MVFAILAGIFLPALLPARRAPLPESVWVIIPVVLFACVVASLVALFRKRLADRFAGGVAGILTLWLVYAFYRAIS